MKRGILETIAILICFSGLIAYFHNLYLMIPMFILMMLYYNME
jgi:hypothetical protein